MSVFVCVCGCVWTCAFRIWTKCMLCLALVINFQWMLFCSIGFRLVNFSLASIRLCHDRRSDRLVFRSLPLRSNNLYGCKNNLHSFEITSTNIWVVLTLLANTKLCVLVSSTNYVINILNKEFLKSIYLCKAYRLPDRSYY